MKAGSRKHSFLNDHRQLLITNYYYQSLMAGQALLRKHSIILALYLFITLVMTLPLALCFVDHVPGSETWALDEYTFVWNFWWLKHAIFDLGASPLHTNFIFYPIGSSLVLYTFNLLNAILAIPIEFIFGYPAAVNSLLVFSFVASAYGAFLLVDCLLRRSERFRDADPALLTLAAFVGGSIFAFTASRFVYASLGHYNFVSSQYLPFYALFFIKTIRESSLKSAILAGLFAAFAILTETTYAVFIVLFSLLYLPFALRAREFNRRSLLRLLVMGVCAVVVASPLLVPSLIELTANTGYTLPAWGHGEKLLVDFFGLFTPTGLQLWNRIWVQELDAVRQGTFRFVDVNTVFLGYATLALAFVGAWVFRKFLFVWIASAVTFAILSFGPLLHFNGQSVFDLDGLSVTFPMPFLILHYIPFLKENRVPNRFGILVILALAVLAAFAVAWMGEKLRTKSLRLAQLCAFSFLLVVLFEHASIPLPLTDARVPDVYQQIAREPGNYAILSLPFGFRNSFTTLGAEDTRTQYYQSVHGKYLLSGNTSRNPPIQFDYFDRISFFHSLAQVELYNPVPADVLARDKVQAVRLASFFDIRYVVINAAAPNRLPYSDTRDDAMEYVRTVLPLGDKIYDRDGIVAFRVNQAPLPSKLQFNLGTDDAKIYQAEGWDRDEEISGTQANWANRQSARLLIPVRAVSDYELTLRVLPFTYSNSPAQSMEILANDQSIQKFELKSGWENYPVTVPARALHQGVNDIVLRFTYAARAREVLPANFEIGSTGTSSPVDIVVNSYDLGSIVVNGREASKLGRGYNIVVLDSHGNVIDARVFNTADDGRASRALTDFIAKIPDYSIVAVASQEEMAGNLDDAAVAALRSIGARVDMRKNPNHSDAIIGVKGAPPGTALEQANEGASFISVGHVPDDRTLAAAVSAVTIEMK
jgi:interleukin-like EMT inducer protein